MTEMTETMEKALVHVSLATKDNMCVLPSVAFSAGAFNGTVFSTAAGLSTLKNQRKAANHTTPSILQQIAHYKRLQTKRG
jgi:hypothetical protein